jgi:tetratricopeptide (TPR) repeat protein
MLRSITIPFALVGASCAAAAEDQAQSPDQIASAAREAARNNQHDAAIAAFRQAMAMAPDRRTDWLLELADQLTWSGKLDEAIALYREAVAFDDPGKSRAARIGLARALSWQGKHGQSIEEYGRILARDPSDLEAGLNRAEVLTWANRLGAAVAAYDAVLQQHPGNMDALRRKARLLSWRGRHREAIKMLDPVLAERGSDRDAALVTAESYAWMGRPDRAEQLLRKQLAADTGDSRAAQLLEKLELNRRPAARADLRVFDQSDDLEITQIDVETRFSFAQGRGAVGPRFSRSIYRPPSGPIDRIIVDRPGLRANYRLSDTVDWNGSIALDRIRTRGLSSDRETVTYETYITFTPVDRLRIDIGSSRWTFDSEATLTQGLVATQANGSADFNIDENTRVSLRGSWTDYSDGNNRTYWQFQADRRISQNPRVIVSYRYTGFDFSEPGKNGYYNPDRFHSHDAAIQASDWIGDKFRWELKAAAGREKERGGNPRTTVSASAGLGWKLLRDLELEIAYDYSSSRTFATGGFSRGIGRIGIIKRF